MRTPVEVDDALLAAMPLPQPGEGDDKDDRGQALILAGGPEVPGVAVMTAEATLRAGAGKLQIGVPEAMTLAVGVAVPEALVLALDGPELGEPLRKAIAQADTVVLGPGWVDEAQAGALTCAVIAVAAEADEPPTLLIDAAAMTALAATPETVRSLQGRAVLTPHAGETASLLDRPKEEIEADPLAAAAEAARRFGAVVALKGSTTHIAAPDGRAWSHRGGVAGLGTSGSGDVLAGLIGGLLARGCTPEQGAVWGVRLHAMAGERLSRRIGPLGFLARELAAEVPAIMAALAP
jgi:hydroxyethylthiazole kinase-like uncharacterized protein yjeF